jgi:hypothetical protein
VSEIFVVELLAFELLAFELLAVELPALVSAFRFGMCRVSVVADARRARGL